MVGTPSRYARVPYGQLHSLGSSPVIQRPFGRSAVTAAGMAAVVLGTAWLCAWLINARRDPALLAADFTQLWRAGRAVSQHLNPYDVVQASSLPYPLRDPLGYPMTAVVATLPFAMLSPFAAAQLWNTLSLASFIGAALWRRPAWLGMLLSPSLMMAVQLVQWSPVLAAGTLVPPLSLLYSAKPNIGIALFAGWPSRWAVFGAVLLTIIGLLLVPSWPLDWFRSVYATSNYYVAPAAVWHAGGPFLLLTMLCWRQPEARVLAVLALVPHNLVLYEQLVLVTICRRPGEVGLLVAGAWAALIWGGVARAEQATEAAQHAALRVPVIVGCYLPALLIVLRRGNRGDLPAWLETRLAGSRIPAALRGSGTALGRPSGR